MSEVNLPKSNVEVPPLISTNRDRDLVRWGYEQGRKSRLVTDEMVEMLYRASGWTSWTEDDAKRGREHFRRALERALSTKEVGG